MSIVSERAGLVPRLAPTPTQHGVIAMGTRGMVATAHPLSALVGMNVLMRGGNAVDAAIATAAVECVVLPAMCGLGGDAFAIVYEARSGQLTAINGSGIAPATATRDYFVSHGYKKMPLYGMLSVAVPGAVDVYEKLWRRFGTMDWAELWEPAIRLAEDGHPLGERMSGRIAESEAKLAKFPTSARIFLPYGRVPAPGDILVQKELAASMRLVAKGGADAFYRGEIARRIVAFSRENGGLFTEEDFAGHSSDIYTPLRTTYRGYEVYETAPPSQGLIVLEELNLVEGFDLQGMGFLSAQAIHTMVEAKKLAFADRLRHCADPRFVKNPLPQLLSKAHAARRRRLIDPERAMDSVPGTDPEDLVGDTTYFAVVDRDGNAVSFIHSLSASFGSGVVAGDTGILLNNRAGRGFSLVEGHINVIEPGKRTMHTLNCYMIFRDGKPWVVGGTPGGDQQPQWNLQIITDLIDFGLNVQEAAEAPRWFSFPGTDPEFVDEPFELWVEDRIAPEVRHALEAKGHRVKVLGPWDSGGVVQLIMIDQERGVLLGGSDPRGGGLALGW